VRWLKHCWGGLLAVFAAACAPTLPETVATVTLVPPTLTPVLTQAPPTPTRSDLLNPSDLAQGTPSAAVEALLPSVIISAGDVDMLKALLAQTLEVDVRMVRWVNAEAARWPFASTRCHRPDPSGRVSGLRVFFLVGMTVYEFQQQGDAPYRFCRETSEARDALLLAVDPVAAELVRLAQQRIAAQLDLPARRVTWTSVEAFRWWDTSLGCPLAGQTYQLVDVPGYRIVLQAGDTRYVFHTDSERLFPCAAGMEVLTPPLRPIPTAETTPEA
jgi:hypothetical protein